MSKLKIKKEDRRKKILSLKIVFDAVYIFFKKKFDTQFCGTHLKCSTYTEFKYIDNINPIIDKIVSAIDVKGVILGIRSGLSWLL